MGDEKKKPRSAVRLNNKLLDLNIKKYMADMAENRYSELRGKRTNRGCPYKI